jgi:hypothetical protein
MGRAINWSQLPTSSTCLTKLPGAVCLNNIADGMWQVFRSNELKETTNRIAKFEVSFDSLEGWQALVSVYGIPMQENRMNAEKWLRI